MLPNCYLPEVQLNCTTTVLELSGTSIHRKQGEIIHSSSAGYLLRTKRADSDEGGYYTGNSSLDTPFLLGDEEMVEELKDPTASCC